MKNLRRTRRNSYILSDVGVNVATQLTEDLRYEAKLENAKRADRFKRVIIEKFS